MKTILFALLLLSRIGFTQTAEIPDSAKIKVEYRIKLINQKIKENGLKWNAGITSLSYLPDDEILKLICRKSDSTLIKKPQANNFTQKIQSSSNSTQNTPTVSNWVNMMDPVTLQTSEYGCWAWASASAATGLLNKYYGSNIGIRLDPVNIQSYLPNSGGYVSTGFNIILNNKARCIQGINSFPNFDNAYYTISDRQDVYPSGVAVIKDALLTSPVIAQMTVYPSFIDYNGGVYKPVSGESSLGTHIVVIVGYIDPNQDGACWICRNSWGPNWGEREDGQIDPTGRGYFKIGFGQCDIDNYCVETGTVTSISCFSKVIP